MRAISLQTDLLLQAMAEQSRQTREQMAEINHHLRNQAANEANEHFLVGDEFPERQDFAGAGSSSRSAAILRRSLRDAVCGRFLQLRAGPARRCATPSKRPCRKRPMIRRKHVASGPGRALPGPLGVRGARLRPGAGLVQRAYQEEPRLWTALVEAAASVLLDPSRPDRAANVRAVQKVFNRQPAGNWPTCCGTHWAAAGGVAPDTARDAFRCAAKGDYRAGERSRVEVVALLWRLYPRMTEPLLELVADEFQWLN